MNWYLAKIVFQIICGEGSHTPQFDEQLRLISAPSGQQAFLKARELGHREEDSFISEKKQLVQWRFVDVCELYPLHELIDGAELYSRIQEVEHADSFVQVVRRRADALMGENILKTLNLV